MDNRSILVIGILKDLKVKLANFLEATYKVDITVVDVPPNYGMLLSRQCIVIVGGNV